MDAYKRVYQRACDYANQKADSRNEHSDGGNIYFAKWFLDRYKELFDNNFTHHGVEYVCEEGDQSMRYINMGEAYQTTIICEAGKCYVGTYGDWVEGAERKYCEEENKVRCAACGEFSDKNDSGECTYCEDHYVDGRKIPEIGSQLTNCTELRDGDYDMLWVDNEQVGTHATKSRYTTIIVRLQYTDQYDSEWARDHDKYHVEILAVTPGIVRKKERESLLNYIGQTQEDWDKWPEHVKCEACIDYGTHATLWQRTGNDSNALLCEAEKERQLMHLLIGFKLDGPQNAIGTTGWQRMRGDILGGLKG